MHCDHQAEASKPLTKQLFLKRFLQALLFGLLFVPIVLVVLLVLTLIERYRYDHWSFQWIWERGGFPCIGLFAITSASFFLHQNWPCRFVTALAITSLGTLLIDSMGGGLDLAPVMVKSIKVHWLRPVFIAWLVVPPWSVAFVCLWLARRRQSTPKIP